MKTIPLSRGKVTIVDDGDFQYLAQWKWFCSSKGYAVRTLNIKGNKPRTIYMHKEILPSSSGQFADHINRDPLDNRRSNLRLCTKSQNAMNRTETVKNRSGFKGVYPARNSAKHPWAAKIQVRGRDIRLGVFETPRQAAAAYNDAARKYHGEFAFTNPL